LELKIHIPFLIAQDIGTNMASLENRFLRNKDLINQSLLDEITVIGLGGIGSTVVTLLAIMGWDRIIGWDDDKLETHNLSSTTYPTRFVGLSKIETARAIVSDYSAAQTQFVVNKGKWSQKEGIGHKVITCLDNMDTRMEAYETWAKIDNSTIIESPKKPNKFFIDLRMSALSLEMITITHRPGGFTNKNTENWDDIYDSYWVPDSQIEPAPCTMKHTIFASSIIGGLGVNQVFNCVANKPYYSYIWAGLLPLNLEKDNLVKPIMNGV